MLNRQKILLVDTDPEFIDQIREIINSLGFEPIVCTTFQEAMLAIKIDPVSSVIINFKIQDELAIESIVKIKQESLTIPILLVIDNRSSLKDEQLNSQELIQLGVNLISAKPIHQEKVSAFIRGDHYQDNDDFSESTNDQIVQDDNFYTAISITSFFPKMKILFDTYLRLRKDRYVRILKAGDSFSKEFLERYQFEKHIQHFHFSVKDRKRYIEFCNNLLKKIGNKKTISSTAKITFLQESLNKVMEEVYSEGIKKESIELGKMVCQSISELISQQRDLVDLLESLVRIDPDSMSHAFLTTFIANMVASKFDYFSSMNSETLSLACMFHDVGKSMIPAEIIPKRPYQMSAKELELYERHPMLGAEIINAHKIMNPSVGRIIHQHHECHDGSGFPYGLRGNKIMNLAKFVHFSDELSHIMLDKRINPVEAFKLLIKDPESQKKFNPEVFEVFRTLVTKSYK